MNAIDALLIDMFGVDCYSAAVQTLDSTREQLIADILQHVYGDSAADLIHGSDHYAWREEDVIRDAKGRFAEKHSAESLSEVHGAIDKALRGDKTPKSASELMTHLGRMTVKQLQDLKGKYGIAAKGRLKADLVQAIAQQLDDGHRSTLDSKLNDGLKALPLEQQQSYRQSVSDVLSAMPEAARQRMAQNLESFQFHDTREGLHDYIGGVSTKAKGFLDRGGEVGGAFNISTGIAVLDGGMKAATQTEVYAHELMHAVDGRKGQQLSNAPEWQKAWKEEGSVSRYGNASASESFAEFGRVLFGLKASVDAVKKKYPQSMAFLEKHGLIPSKPGKDQPVQEVFDTPINDGDQHADGKAVDAPGDKPPTTQEPENLFNQHKGLVESIVRKFGKPADYDDLRQEGNIALWEASKTFNPEGGASFSTHAYNKIQGAISNTVRKGSAQKRGAKVTRGFATDNEGGAEEASVAGKSADPAAQAEQSDQLALAQKALASLDEDARQMFTDVMMNGKSMQEVATERGVSLQAVSQKLKRTTEKLQAMVNGGGKPKPEKTTPEQPKPVPAEVSKPKPEPEKKAGRTTDGKHGTDEPFRLEPPRREMKKPKFDAVDQGPQGALFDAGKNDLPGQNLLFNTDPGAGNDVSTMESKMRKTSADLTATRSNSDYKPITAKKTRESSLEDLHPRVRTAVNSVADEWGVDPEKLLDVAGQQHQLNMQDWETREAVKKHARKTLGINQRTTTNMENRRSKKHGEDFANKSGVDQVVTEAQSLYPGFNWGQDPARALMEAVNEGAKPQPKLHDKNNLDSAASYLQRTYGELEAAPFHARNWTDVDIYSLSPADLDRYAGWDPDQHPRNESGEFSHKVSYAELVRSVNHPKLPEFKPGKETAQLIAEVMYENGISARDAVSELLNDEDGVLEHIFPTQYWKSVNQYEDAVQKTMDSLHGSQDYSDTITGCDPAWYGSDTGCAYDVASELAQKAREPLMATALKKWMEDPKNMALVKKKADSMNSRDDYGSPADLDRYAAEITDTTKEKARLIAEILTAIYGLDVDPDEPDQYAWLNWDENEHPRDRRGRFAKKAEMLADVSAKVGEALKGKRTKTSANELAGMLANLSVKELHALKKTHGISASGVKSDLITKIANRLDSGRRADMSAEPVIARTRLTDKQIKNAASDTARKMSRDNILAQINFINGQLANNPTHTMMDELYIHQTALGTKIESNATQTRMTDNQINKAAKSLATRVSVSELQAQIDYYNKPGVIKNAAQLDDLYVYLAAVRMAKRKQNAAKQVTGVDVS